MSAADTAKPMTARRSAPLSGTAEVPGDKSVSHRALILGALAVGETRIAGLLEADDIRATAAALRLFGAELAPEAGGVWSVHGVGVGGFAEPADIVDCANSGTGARLLMGAMATTPVTAGFTGDASLRARPMGRITDPLAAMGARAYGRSGGRLPLTLIGAEAPVPLNYDIPVPSAQVKSAVLLAGLGAPGRTIVREAVTTRDHTERMLAAFGAEIAVAGDGAGRTVTLAGQPELAPRSLSVPRDPSAAAFPIAAALMVPGSGIRVPAVALNPSRSGFLTTIREMGADVVAENERDEGGEPVADLRVRYTPDLTGVEVPTERAAAMIDEYPILAALAATATGATVMRGVGELRVKESDRIAAMADGLAACGVEVEAGAETLTVRGRGAGGVTGGARCESRHDHRIAMAFLCLGLAAERPVTVDDARPVATSFPGFAELMRGLGGELAEGVA